MGRCSLGSWRRISARRSGSASRAAGNPRLASHSVTSASISSAVRGLVCEQLLWTDRRVYPILAVDCEAQPAAAPTCSSPKVEADPPSRRRMSLGYEAHEALRAAAASADPRSHPAARWRRLSASSEAMAASAVAAALAERGASQGTSTADHTTCIGDMPAATIPREMVSRRTPRNECVEDPGLVLLREALLALTPCVASAANAQLSAPASPT